MQFIDFKKKLADYPIFSLTDLRKIFDEFPYRQLDRWEKKGYLKKVKRGFYCLPDRESDQNFLFYMANRMYSPSYISLERALRFYGLIPEEIFQVTSVSSKKTASFETSVGNFSYRQIKPSLFWGYHLMDFGKQKILLAEPEKALLDYFYLNPKIETADDFREMRINAAEFHERTNLTKFHRYLEAFENLSLKKRAEVFLTTIQT